MFFGVREVIRANQKLPLSIKYTVCSLQGIHATTKKLHRYIAQNLDVH